MYPGARIHYVNNMDPKNIKTELARIANEDWDAIVMPHSLIDRMALKRETLMELAADDIAEVEEEAMSAAREDGVSLTPEMMDRPGGDEEGPVHHGEEPGQAARGDQSEHREAGQPGNAAGGNPVRGFGRRRAPGRRGA